jgi:hypothetical protein
MGKEDIFTESPSEIYPHSLEQRESRVTGDVQFLVLQIHKLQLKPQCRQVQEVRIGDHEPQ